MMEFLFGGVLLLFSGSGLQNLANTLLAGELREDPTDFLALFILHAVPFLIFNKLYFGVALFASGLIKLVSVIGMLRHKDWGYYLLLWFSILVLPFSVINLILKFDLFSAILLAVDVLVIALLLFYKKYFLAK